MIAVQLVSLVRYSDSRVLEERERERFGELGESSPSIDTCLRKFVGNMAPRLCKPHTEYVINY